MPSFPMLSLVPLEQFSCKPIDRHSVLLALNWIRIHLIRQFLSENHEIFNQFQRKSKKIPKYMLSCADVCYARWLVPQHESKKRFHRSSFEFLQRARRGGSFDKWPGAAAISITTFFSPLFRFPLLTGLGNYWPAIQVFGAKKLFYRLFYRSAQGGGGEWAKRKNFWLPEIFRIVSNHLH